MGRVASGGWRGQGAEDVGGGFAFGVDSVGGFLDVLQVMGVGVGDDTDAVQVGMHFF